jgi:hypothetical protein
MTAHPDDIAEDLAGHVELLNMLAAAFDAFEWNDTRLGAYLAATHDIDVGLLRQATSNLMRQHRGKMPVPAAVRAAALELLTGAVLDAGGAWAEVMAAARHLGRYHEPHWSSPLVAEALRHVGGYRSLCDSENVVAERARFCDAYDRLVARAEREALMSEGLAAAAALVAGSAALPPPPES